MAAYMVAQVVVTDKARFQVYREAFPGTLGDSGCKVLSATPAVDVPEGEWPPGNTVILEFPSMDKLQAWYHSPEYQAAIKLRESASKASVAFFEGV